MDALSHLLAGFSLALTPTNLFMAFLGALLGTIVGVLPGLGPTSTIAILLPLTTVLEPASAIIMMAGIYYGAQYGGSTTAILLNIPGEVSSVPTLLDGHPLAKQGRAGPALAIAAIGSFIAGTGSVFALVFIGPLLADQALKFGPPEYFGLMVLALTVIVSLGGASLAKAILVGTFGCLISLVGMGPSTGLPRFHYGTTVLYGGIDIITIAIGVFAISEVFLGIEESRKAVAPAELGSIFPRFKEIKETLPAMLRGGGIGFLLGLLPGCSPAVTTFIAYDAEKKVSRHPEKFGKGAMEGVAAPESANNATATAGFIPLMALGIPASPPLAILLGGLMIYGLQPGPLLFQSHPDFVWAVIASMYIGNVMLLILNLPLVGLWARFTTVPYGIMAPIILLISFVGAYSVRNSMFDLGMSLVFGFIGYLMRKYDWPTAPLVLCAILGPMLEKSLVQSLAMSAGDPLIFVTRPISLTLLIIASLLLVLSLYLVRATRKKTSESLC
jgi:putative tricarboxylic transport membrane protein